MTIKSVSLTDQKTNETQLNSFEGSSSSSSQLGHVFDGNVNPDLLISSSVEKIGGQVDLPDQANQIVDALTALQLVFSEEVTLTFPNGSRYQGGWKNGLPEGYGRLILSNQGSEIFYGYDGQWLNGQRHGKGLYVYENFRYEGDWVDGEMHGYGKLIAFSSEKVAEKYEGYFSHNQYHGKGKLRDIYGSEAEGDFVAGLLHGRIKISLGNGDKFEGDYVEADPPHD